MMRFKSYEEFLYKAENLSDQQAETKAQEFESAADGLVFRRAILWLIIGLLLGWMMLPLPNRGLTPLQEVYLVVGFGLFCLTVAAVKAKITSNKLRRFAYQIRYIKWRSKMEGLANRERQDLTESASVGRDFVR